MEQCKIANVPLLFQAVGGVKRAEPGGCYEDAPMTNFPRALHHPIPNRAERNARVLNGT